jgi:endogenous inhibitor of DNA gyrase (YacG/DUF329 family)
MNEVLNCPFCGGEAKIEHYEKDGYLPHCTECCGMVEKWFGTEEEAIAAWEKRYTPEPKPLTLDELKEREGKPVYHVVIGQKDSSGWIIAGLTRTTAKHGLLMIMSQKGR